MDKLVETMPRVARYLAKRDFSGVPSLEGRTFEVEQLAQGEYNLNYLIRSGADRFVFRVNVGTQIGRDDQILYEYKALEILEPSGVTPKPLYVDDGRESFQLGILIMEYLPGEPLDYGRDLGKAAWLFSRVHQVEVEESRNHLIREDAPLTLLFEECSGLLQKYFDSELADPGIRAYLMDVRDWADENRKKEEWYQRDPWNCVVNTEVNNRNFIVGRERDTIHLVDWEMPRWGDPSQDLSHFSSPLTTLWKTDFRMSGPVKKEFMEEYKRHMKDPHLRDTLEDRVRLRDPFVLMRGISWSAMGWAAYQSDFEGVRNQDTWETLQKYMSLDFIRSLFDPYIKS